MRCKLYKLNFESYLHSRVSLRGITFPGSDTIFAAVANAIAELDGEKEVIEFCRSNPRFSSCFPYWKEKIFLPNHKGWKDADKALKRAKWIEASLLEKEPESQKFEVVNGFIVSEKEKDKDKIKVYKEVEIARNAKSRINETTNLYSIRAFKFEKDSGLYFLYDGEIEIEHALKYLADVGICGLKSIGFGKYKLNKGEFSWDHEGKFGLLLSKCLPAENEYSHVAKGLYEIEERGGWYDFYGRYKRKGKVRVLKEGSILPTKLRGKVVEVNGIYRNYLAFILPLRWYDGD
ncbi:type III-A CRISPR-associated RAMP protein Csm4 [Archaeoglobales archaeon]|nr:MAG: type III-A CRISPR-associated RAMP protein Csm4 [Archaeoglobales archaeon]